MQSSKRMPLLVGGGVMVCLVISVAAAPDAGAVPSFSRKYGTSCQTCHTVYPVLNSFGEAFRRNGYRFPSSEGSVDSDAEKPTPVPLGQEQYKDIFPAAVWPDKILEAVPLSVWLNGGVPFNLPNTDAKAAAGNGFTWGGVVAEMHLFGAGAFNDNLTYMTQLTLESDFGSPPGSFDIETAYLMWSDIVGPRHAVNLWIGRLFAPQLTSYGLHSSYLSDTVMPGVSVGALYNPAAGFTVGMGHTDGVELNGIIGHRLGYSVGWVASMAASGLSLPNAQDAYVHVGYKLGGIALDGEGAGGTASADPLKPWAEKSITLDLFAYHGLTQLDNGTGTVAGGAVVPVLQSDPTNVVGGVLHAQLDSLVIMAGLQSEHHARPYVGTPATVDPTSGAVVNGTADNTGSTTLVQYDEVNYIVWPWFVPGVRVEYTHASVEGGNDAQLMRIVPGIAMLVRPNIRVAVIGDVEWATNLPPAGNWGGAGGIISPPPASAPGSTSSKTEAELVMATFGVGF
jgi:hypothetical protein